MKTNSSKTIPLILTVAYWVLACFGAIHGKNIDHQFEPGMVAKMKCGLVLVQWRDADSTGRKCKRCK